MLPFAVVIFINGLKDFLEDWKRKKSDDEENERKIEILNIETNQFEIKSWKEVKLGHIIKVNENEYFPADIVLINTHKSKKENVINDGICYIESKNLDGETSLKYKQSHKDVSKHYYDDLSIKKIKGRVECEQPNEFIYEFNAKMYISLEDVHLNIDKNNFILRGCSLKQTYFIYGLVVYVGHNSKIMKNSPSARAKTSKLESIMNIQIIIVFLIQFSLSVLGAILYLIWQKDKTVI